MITQQKRTIYSPNKFHEVGKFVFIELFGRDCKTKGFAIIDAKDYRKVSQRKWCLQKNGYVESGTPPNRVYLHRHILGVKQDLEIDHINGTRTDCRKSNLRFVTSYQNKINSRLRTDNKSGYKGVCWSVKRQKWEVRIQVKGKQKHLGRFKNFDDAVSVRQKAEEKYFKDN